MAIFQEIPLSGQAQTFRINILNVKYTFSLYYRTNTQGGGWFLDIGDQFNNPICSGIPLVTGANLLAQYSHLFPFGLAVNSDSNPSAVPTYQNLGTTSHLYVVLP